MAEQRRVTGAVRGRRNLRWIAVGVLAICLGGLGAALLYGNLSNSHSVVTVNRTVFRDQLITAADLGVTSLPPAPGVEVVPSDRIEEVVGHTALYDLAEGSLLSPRSYGEPRVADGEVLVGLRLAAGRIPSTPMAPGTEVLLVPVGRDGGEPPAGSSVAGRVSSPAGELPDGASVVDVSVSADEAERVARLAAADQLVLVRKAGTPR